MNPSPIRHDLSRLVTDLTPKRSPSVQKMANTSLCVAHGGDGLVTDFHRAKVYKYKRNLSLYMYMSPCHAHTPAMRVRTHEGIKDGFTVTDSQARQSPSLRSRRDERTATLNHATARHNATVGNTAAHTRSASMALSWCHTGRVFLRVPEWQSDCESIRYSGPKRPAPGLTERARY